MSHLLTGFFRQGTHKKTAGVKRDYNRLGNHYRSLVKWILQLATNQQVGVRFSQDRPYYRLWGIGANWEHMCFASMSQQFESAILHQSFIILPF